MTMDYQGTFRTMFRSLRGDIVNYCKDHGIHVNESKEGRYYRMDFYGYEDNAPALYKFINAQAV